MELLTQVFGLFRWPVLGEEKSVQKRKFALLKRINPRQSDVRPGQWPLVALTNKD